MSIEAMTLVLNHSKATGRAKLVLIGIANHQGDQGSWPSIETLARYANASERSVIRDIQELEELGELIVERNAAPIRGQYRPNLYWVNVSAPGVTNFESGMTELASGVTNQVVRGDTVVTLNVINPKKNLKETYGDFDVVFDRFWSVYPRKENKQSARRAFRKALTVASVDVILAGATRFGSDPNLPETQFIPHAATWLNQERWDNPPLPERVLSPEQRAEIEAAKRRSQLERDRQATEQWLAEQRELAEQVRLNPPKRCEHDRIEVLCPRCNTKLNN